MCIRDRLDNLLLKKKSPKAYVGFEPSGLLHAGSLVPMLKCKELVQAGFDVTILLAEQNARQDGIEQSQPPLDLIESLYAELNQMQEDFQNLKPRIKVLEEQLEQQNEGILEAGKEPLKLGMLALMAGNPDSAAEYFRPFLAEEAEPKIRNNLMMALANSYLAQGFAEQAASYYGTVIGLSEKGRHYPLALFSLGKAF